MPTPETRATNRLAEALVGLVQETVESAMATALAALAAHDARLGGGVWLSAGDVARQLSVSTDKARDLLSDQGIQPLKIGSMQRYSAAEVKGWLDSLIAEQRPRVPVTLATPAGVTVIEPRRRNKRKAG